MLIFNGKILEIATETEMLETDPIRANYWKFKCHIFNGTFNMCYPYIGYVFIPFDAPIIIIDYRTEQRVWIKSSEVERSGLFGIQKYPDNVRLVKFLLEKELLFWQEIQQSGEICL